MAKVPHWEDAPFLWQQVKIGNVYLPGIATVSGNIKRKSDNQGSPGSDGSTMTQLGYDGAKVSIKLVLVFPRHLEDLQKIIPTLRPRKGEKNPPPVTVVHPALEILGIRQLHVMEIGVPEPGQVKGTYEVKLELDEFIPETKRPNRVGKPASGRGAGPGPGTQAGGGIDLVKEFGGPTAPKAKPPSFIGPLSLTDLARRSGGIQG